MIQKKVSYTKNYNNLRMHLERVHSIRFACKFAHFLLNKFLTSRKPTQYVVIYKSELILAGVLTEKDHLYEWRREMYEKQILICKADFEECENTDANAKCSEYKFGSSIAKYISRALDMKNNIHENFDKKADQEQVDRLEIFSKENEERVKKLEEKVDKMIAYILKKMPPDNDIRREIVQNNIDDTEQMERCLRAEKKSHKKNDISLKKKNELRIIC